MVIIIVTELYIREIGNSSISTKLLTELAHKGGTETNLVELLQHSPGFENYGELALKRS